MQLVYQLLLYTLYVIYKRTVIMHVICMVSSCLSNNYRYAIQQALRIPSLSHEISFFSTGSNMVTQDLGLQRLNPSNVIASCHQSLSIIIIQIIQESRALHDANSFGNHWNVMCSIISKMNKLIKSIPVIYQLQYGLGEHSQLL